MNNYFAVLLDVSRNGVIKVNKIKQFIDYISEMGYNALELYSEDMYEVKEYPELGYLRGKYSIDDLKELDKYAKEKGIELVPCIQTLAHFTNFKKTLRGEALMDFDDILLCDNEETYKFIDCLFKTCSEAFASRKINIGMDEAHMLGLGKYLDKNGFVKRTDILLKHLQKVAAIAKKYGYTCHMWSDMFVRLTNNGNYWVDDPSKLVIDDSIKKQIPENVSLIYWDYYSVDEEHYSKQFEVHKKLNNDFSFAGGAISWLGFAPANKFTLNAMEPAFKACLKNDVKDIIVTMWGDNGKECSFFNLLPSLFALSEYYKGNFDLDLIKKQFGEKFNLSFDDFMLLDSAQYFKDTEYKDYWDIINRGNVFTDPFVPVNQVAYNKRKHIDYLEAYSKLIEAGERNKKFEYLFLDQAYLCKFEAYKFDLSKELRESYQNGDKKKLSSLIITIDKCVESLDQFKEYFYIAYLEDNKSYGIEIHNIRLGGLKERLLFCKDMINKYLSGEIEEIEELKEKLIETEDRLNCVYQLVISPSNITHG